MLGTWASEIAAVKSALSLVDARVAVAGGEPAGDRCAGVGRARQGLTDALVALERLAAEPPAPSAEASEPTLADPFRTRVRVKARALADAVPVLSLIEAELDRPVAPAGHNDDQPPRFVRDRGPAEAEIPLTGADTDPAPPGIEMTGIETAPLAASAAHEAALAAQVSSVAEMAAAGPAEPPVDASPAVVAEPAPATTPPEAVDLPHVLHLIRAHISHVDEDAGTQPGESYREPAEPAQPMMDDDPVIPDATTAATADVSGDAQIGDQAQSFVAFQSGFANIAPDYAAPVVEPATVWSAAASPGEDIDAEPPALEAAEPADAADDGFEADVQIIRYEAAPADAAAMLAAAPSRATLHWQPRAQSVRTVLDDAPVAYRSPCEEATVVIVQRRGEHADLADLPFYQTSPLERRESKVRRFLSALSGDRA